MERMDTIKTKTKTKNFQEFLVRSILLRNQWRYEKLNIDFKTWNTRDHIITRDEYLGYLSVILQSNIPPFGKTFLIGAVTFEAKNRPKKVNDVTKEFVKICVEIERKKYMNLGFEDPIPTIGEIERAYGKPITSELPISIYVFDIISDATP